jgi:endoglucanase
MRTKSMKSIKVIWLVFFITLTALFFLNTCQSSEDTDQQTVDSVTFSRGVTFSGWFELVSSAYGIQTNRYTKQDFADVKSLGVDVIRLPIDSNVLSSGAPDYVIDPFALRLIDNAVELAEKNHIYIILDNHCGGNFAPNRNFLLSVWRQLAEHFKNRSNYVIYEIMNEPNGVSDSDWGRMQGEVINAIREIDQNKWIVVSGIHTYEDPAVGLSALPIYTDNRLLYTIHFYEPFLFTHQGASWGPYEALAGIPFPYNKNKMPSLPIQLRGTDVEQDFINYNSQGTKDTLTEKIDKVANFVRERNVSIFCGEFGVLMRYAPFEDRVSYYQFIREMLEERNIPWITWNYFDAFGIFNPPNGIFEWWFRGDINYDLNVKLVKALGLTPPAQRQRKALTSGFIIFDDYFGNGIETKDIPNYNNFFFTPAAKGEYAIYLKIAQFYGINLSLGLRDLSYLASNGYVLEFKARTEMPVKYEVGFDSVQGNVTWRVGTMITEDHLLPDGKWHTIRIPLDDMIILFGFDNNTQQYIDPISGINPWTSISAFDFKAHHDDGSIREIYLDDIKIIK